jgi:hypothetical protein
MRLFVSVVVCAALATGAMAADDWGFISTAGSPDTAYTFDLTSPAAITPLGPVDGNFNRGMDFDSPDSFYYYVSTDALNDPGDKGLWYWKNGVNTQLFANSFVDGTDGDLALSNDGDKAYITVDEGDDVALWVYEGLISGSITLTKVGLTGLGTNFPGLAMDPRDGKLYGMNGNDSFYQIDTTSGAAALIGAAGSTINAIGGMDFTPDGSTLLFADGSDEFLKIDPTTGVGSPSGDTPQNISALSFRVPEPASALMLLGLALLRRR